MSQETHTCLFVFADESVFRYKAVKDKEGRPYFKRIPYKDGEIGRIFSDDFWNDWDRDFGYLAGDGLDYAVLSDKDDKRFEAPGNYTVCNPTRFFTFERMRSFMDQHLEYDNISLSYRGKTEPIKGMVVKSRKHFYLDIPYPAEQKIDDQSISDGLSLGDYCTDIVKEWNKNRK